VIVEEGAELRLYMEPLIPFANSHLRQRTVLEVRPGGTLLFWEGFMTGRVGKGESWEFRELASETRLRVAESLAYLDRFRVRPDASSESPYSMRRNTYVGTGIYVGKEARRVAAELHESLPSAGVDALSDSVAIARVVANNGPDFQRARDEFCRVVERGGLPLS
jgi:urease accessory protein UreH